MSQLSKAYQNFFIKSEEGQHFVKTVGQMITSAHEQAETDPDHARDYTMSAKASRDILKHIQSVTNEAKKGKSIS